MSFTLPHDRTAALLYGSLLLLGDAPREGLMRDLGMTRPEVEALARRFWEVYGVAQSRHFELSAQDEESLALAIPTCIALMPQGMIESMIGCDLWELEDAHKTFVEARRIATGQS